MLLGEMADSRPGVGKVKDEAGTSYYVGTKVVLREYQNVTKGHKKLARGPP